MFEDLSGAGLAAALAGVDVASLDADAALGYALAAARLTGWVATGHWHLVNTSMSTKLRPTETECAISCVLNGLTCGWQALRLAACLLRWDSVSLPRRRGCVPAPGYCSRYELSKPLVLRNQRSAPFPTRSTIAAAGSIRSMRSTTSPAYTSAVSKSPLCAAAR